MEVATADGNYWLAVNDNLNSAPSLANTAHWHIIGPSTVTALYGSEVFLGAYSDSSDYLDGNQVSAAGNLFLCVEPNGPTYGLSAPPSASWQLMGPSAAASKVGVATDIGTWSPTLEYDPSNEVEYGGYYYQALQQNNDVVPGTDDTMWQRGAPTTAPPPTPVQPWNTLTQYAVGDECTFTPDTTGSGSLTGTATSAASVHRSGLTQNTWSNPTMRKGHHPTPRPHYTDRPARSISQTGCNSPISRASHRFRRDAQSSDLSFLKSTPRRAAHRRLTSTP